MVRSMRCGTSCNRSIGNRLGYSIVTSASETPLRRRTAALAGVTGVVGWVVVVITVGFGTLLRPVADDYCHGRRAGLHPWDAVAVWYQTWVGDLFQVSITSALVGQPLARLPFWLASFIPFLATVVVILGLAIVLGLLAMRARRSSGRLSLLAVSPFVVIAWWGSWWAAVAVAEASEGTGPWLVATAVTNWQTVAVQYALVPALLLAGWFWWDTSAHRRGAGVRIAGFAVLGLLFGTGGLVFGLSMIVAVPLLWAVRSSLARRWLPREALDTVAFTVAGIAGFLVAYFAPGAQLRSAVLLPGRPLPEPDLRSLAAWMFPEAIVDWVEVVATFGTLVALFIALGIGAMLRALSVQLDLRRTVGWGIALVVLSGIVTAISRAGDAFSYVAYWHDVLPRTVVFFAVLALGVAAGWRLASLGIRSVAPVLAIAAAAAIAATLGVVVMNTHIVDRAAQWEVGAAPAGAQDIETDWVRGCWDELGEVRDLPDRG